MGLSAKRVSCVVPYIFPRDYIPTEYSFPTEYIPTIFDNYQTNVLVEGQHVTLMLKDTAGQESFNSMRRLSYRQTDVFVVCYSCDSSSSFENIKQKWIPELQTYRPKSPRVLVATKSDLRDKATDRSAFISTKQGQELAANIKADAFVECSALTREGLETVFDRAIRCVIEPKKKGEWRCGDCTPCTVL